jgi:hypothetical protein
MLKRQGLIDAWHDRRIPAGDDIDSSVSEALDRADVILILVSPDFLASRYCYDVEMKRALERHTRKEARLIPIILRQCDWKQSDFSGLKAVPKDGKPVTKWADIDEAFQDVVEGIRAALPVKMPKTTPVAHSVQESQIEATVPRSSNLRLAKVYNEEDRDRFLDSAIEYMAKFFESTLAQLNHRNPSVDTRFRWIDGSNFAVTVYRDGSAVACCKIGKGGRYFKGITYAGDDNAPGDTINDLLHVVTDKQGIYLSPMMYGYGAEPTQKLSLEGAAEYYWAKLIGPLQ